MTPKATIFSMLLGEILLSFFFLFEIPFFFRSAGIVIQQINKTSPKLFVTSECTAESLRYIFENILVAAVAVTRVFPN